MQGALAQPSCFRRKSVGCFFTRPPSCFSPVEPVQFSTGLMWRLNQAARLESRKERRVSSAALLYLGVLLWRHCGSHALLLAVGHNWLLLVEAQLHAQRTGRSRAVAVCRPVAQHQFPHTAISVLGPPCSVLGPTLHLIKARCVTLNICVEVTSWWVIV